jgi:hypothetical protein
MRAPGGCRARVAVATAVALVSLAPALGPGPARAAVAGGSATDGARPAVADEAAAIAPPALLSQTGLYAADGAIAEGNLPFSPQYPLWTDGAAKARWIRLPAGARIDVTDADAWDFPVGTKLWKEFAWDGRRVETRLLWLAAPGQWVYAAYVWDGAQRDAVLAPDAGVPGVYEVAPGRRHSVPGRTDCLACHAAGPSPVLGFSALQLSDDRDPLAPHAEPLPPGAVTLSTLAARDLLSPSNPAWAAAPPRIRADDPVERAALGYLAANCGACHNDTGPLARLGLALHHRVAGDPLAAEPAVLTAVDGPGRWQVPGVDPDSSRVVAPGLTSHSSLAYRMASRRPSSQMPPLGTVVRDDEGLALVRRWIEGLPGRTVVAGGK